MCAGRGQLGAGRRVQGGGRPQDVREQPAEVEEAAVVAGVRGDDGVGDVRAHQQDHGGGEQPGAGAAQAASGEDAYDDREHQAVGRRVGDRDELLVVARLWSPMIGWMTSDQKSRPRPVVTIAASSSAVAPSTVTGGAPAGADRGSAARTRRGRTRRPATGRGRGAGGTGSSCRSRHRATRWRCRRRTAARSAGPGRRLPPGAERHRHRRGQPDRVVEPAARFRVLREEEVRRRRPSGRPPSRSTTLSSALIQRRRGPDRTGPDGGCGMGRTGELRVGMRDRGRARTASPRCEVANVARPSRSSSPVRAARAAAGSTSWP